MSNELNEIPVKLNNQTVDVQGWVGNKGESAPSYLEEDFNLSDYLTKMRTGTWGQPLGKGSGNIREVVKAFDPRVSTSEDGGPLKGPGAFNILKGMLQRFLPGGETGYKTKVGLPQSDILGSVDSSKSPAMRNIMKEVGIMSMQEGSDFTEEEKTWLANYGHSFLSPEEVIQTESTGKKLSEAYPHGIPGISPESGPGVYDEDLGRSMQESVADVHMFSDKFTNRDIYNSILGKIQGMYPEISLPLGRDDFQSEFEGQDIDTPYSSLFEGIGRGQVGSNIPLDIAMSDVELDDVTKEKGLQGLLQRLLPGGETGYKASEYDVDFDALREDFIKNNAPMITQLLLQNLNLPGYGSEAIEHMESKKDNPDIFEY